MNVTTRSGKRKGVGGAANNCSPHRTIKMFDNIMTSKARDIVVAYAKVAKFKSIEEHGTKDWG